MTGQVFQPGLGERRPLFADGRRFAFCLAGSALAWTPGLAAQVPGPPRAPTREEIERPPPRSADPARPRLTVEGGIERAPCALEAYGDVTFTLAGVAFEDLRGLPAGALRPAYEPFLGRQHPVSALCEIRDRAATILRDAGYVAAVEIPEQRIAGGTVRFRVLMAKLVAIRVRGDAGRAERIIADYLGQLTRQEVFNSKVAERYLLLASDLPGYDVRLALRSAGTAPGEVVGEVIVRRRPGELDVTVQNYGARELGRWGALVRGQVYGLTGMGDRTTFAAFTTADFSEQQTLQAAHELRIGGEGLTLGGTITYAWADPDLGDPNLDIKARTLLATAEARYPFLRSQALSLEGKAGLDIVNQRIAFNGLPLTRDRLRVAFVRMELDAIDAASIGRVGGYTPAEPRWRIGASLEIRRGLGILGASHPCGAAFAACTAAGATPPSRLEGHAAATIFRLQAYGEYRPVPKVTLSLGVRAQYSGRPLLAFEEYSAGNYTAGRGYDPGTLLGDSGIGFQAELRHGSLLAPRPGAFSIQPYAFFDAAWVSNEDRIFPVAGSRRLASAGGGIRAAFGDRARLDLVLAVPLERAGLQTSRGDPRILLSLTTRLWPGSNR